jgi:tRNA modification GTPase
MAVGVPIAVDDTIAAIATAAGPAGVGIVRISGPAALAILAGLAGRPAAGFADRRLVRVRLRDETGAALDDGLAVAMRGPRSFTGEDVVELHGHGGAVNLERLLRAVLAAGARLAAAGEFTRRALRHGRIDLVGAEALLGVIDAGSERALRVARAQLDGALGARLAALEARVVALRAELEAGLDFPEEGLALGAAAGHAAVLDALAVEVAGLAAEGALGRALRDGAAVALRGPVNAGKSSLFNALLGRDRALVAPEPGTTRDYLEERVIWDGVPLTLIDTAGERAALDALEARGIALGLTRAAAADVEVWLVPAGAPADALPPEGALVVWSKADAAPPPDGALATSARTGAGLAALRAAILARVAGAGTPGIDPVVTTARQRDGVARAAAALARASVVLGHAGREELAALELDEARRALAELRAGEVADEVLDELFARFCIGK